MQPIEELICATLRGENPPWPEIGDDEFVSAFLTRSAYHGVQALLDQRLQSSNACERGWPKAVVDACHKAAIAQAMWEMRHRELLKEVLACLANSGVRPILFKGSALAYGVYSSPFLRRRGDTDLLIPLDARDASGNVLESLGFTCRLGLRGDLVSNAAVYSRRDQGVGAHELDVHWRVHDSQILSRLFSYEELHSEAQLLPTLCPRALAAGPAHALLIACMHRLGHRHCPYFVDHKEYYNGDRLIWLYDIHLLVGGLTSKHFEMFLELANRTGLGGACLQSIEEASASFHTFVPKAVRDVLFRLGADGQVSRYLNGSPILQYYANFRAVPGTTDKLRFIIQLLFPPQQYMRQLYPDVKPNWLPWLYLRRATIVILKRFERTIAARPTTSRENGNERFGKCK